jgi:hypothetical protein
MYTQQLIDRLRARENSIDLTYGYIENHVFCSY